MNFCDIYHETNQMLLRCNNLMETDPVPQTD